MGLETALVSFAVLGMRGTWQLSPTGVSLIIASPGVGQFVGSVVLGHLSDRLGRKAAYCLSVALLSAFAALTGLAPQPAVVSGLLFLAGLGQGGAAPVVTAMVTEAAPMASRGRMVGITELMFAGGWTLAAFAGRLLAASASWRSLMAIGALPFVLTPVGLLFLQVERLPEPPGSSGRQNGFAALWRPALRTRTLMLWSLWLAIFTVWFGPVLWLPTLLASIGDPDAAGKASLVAVAMLVGATLVLPVVDRVGRRLLIGPGLAVMAAGCAAMALATTGSRLAAAGIAVGFAGQTIWPVCLTYAAELYPTSIRGIGVGWALAAGRVGAVIAPLALGALLATYGRLPALLLFGIIAGCAAAIVTAAGPETAGRPL
jgi:putative MFS transporter